MNSEQEAKWKSDQFATALQSRFKIVCVTCAKPTELQITLRPRTHSAEQYWAQAGILSISCKPCGNYVQERL